MRFLVKLSDGTYLASPPYWNTRITEDKEKAFVFIDREFFETYYPLLEIEEIESQT